MEQQRGEENRGGDGLAASEWKTAYARFYDAHFSSPAGAAAAASATRDDGDGPLLDEAFPRCEKTAGALADVRDAEWLLDLLADQVAASRPCACRRGPDDGPMCACVHNAAAAFQAATAEYRGGGDDDDDDDGARRAEETGCAHNSRHAVAADGSEDENATSTHVRAAAHHAMSALKCLCGGSADSRNPCLHRCLLHTVFLEKVLGSYSRTSRRRPRDAETQTPRDDDRPMTTGAAADDGSTEKTRRWKLFGWLRRSKGDAKSPRKIKYIQVRVHPKVRKPRATPTAGLGPTADDRNDRGAAGKVKSCSSRWSLLSWLCPKTADDPTAPTEIHDTPSRTRPMELRLTKPPELRTTESSSSSSKSVCLRVLSM